jgi:hypothetical protein
MKYTPRYFAVMLVLLHLLKIFYHDDETLRYLFSLMLSACIGYAAIIMWFYPDLEDLCNLTVKRQFGLYISNLKDESDDNKHS